MAIEVTNSMPSWAPKSCSAAAGKSKASIDGGSLTLWSRPLAYCDLISKLKSSSLDTVLTSIELVGNLEGLGVNLPLPDQEGAESSLVGVDFPFGAQGAR